MESSDMTKLDADYLKEDLLWQIEKDIRENRGPWADKYSVFGESGVRFAAEDALEDLIKRGFVGMETENQDIFYGSTGCSRNGRFRRGTRNRWVARNPRRLLQLYIWWWWWWWCRS
jgi:hypothetical protein